MTYPILFNSLWTESGEFQLFDLDGNLISIPDYLSPPTNDYEAATIVALLFYPDLFYPEFLENIWNKRFEPQVQALDACSPSGLEEGQTTNKSVLFGNDDGCWRYGAGIPDNPNTVVRFGRYTNLISPAVEYDFNNWLIFRNLQIPQGSKINKAVLKLTAYDYGSPINNSEIGVKAYITAHDTTNNTLAERVPSATYNPDTYFQRISTAIEWDIDTIWSNNVVYESPNIACVLQELVDQSGWHSTGQSVKLFIQENGSEPGPSGFATRSFYSFEAASNKTAKLEIWYSRNFQEEANIGIKVGSNPSVKFDYFAEASAGIEVGGTFVSDPFEVNGIVVGTDFAITVNKVERPDIGVGIGTDFEVQTDTVLNSGIGIGTDFEVVCSYLNDANIGIKVGDGFFPNGKRYKRKVTCSATSEVDFFPIVVRLEYSSNHVLDRNDFIVTDENDNELPYVVSVFDDGLAYLSYKVNLKSTEVVSYIYYGG